MNKEFIKFDKITWKLIKYFIYIISIAILICFIGSSLFLSKFYMKNQYKDLKTSSEEIYLSLKEGRPYENIFGNAIIINNNFIQPIGGKRMGLMNNLKNVDFKSLPEQGSFENAVGEHFIYYKLSTELGDIVVFQSSRDISEYLKVIYIVLIFIFLLALFLCIPFISYLGKKFTMPILKLQRASQEIANGNFNANIPITTGDEIEDLSHSLQSMAHSLDKKNELQRNFISNVSHDFKTPLSVIRSYSEAIKDGLVDASETKEYSQEIIEEVDRLNNLVMAIMELSKLQNGKLKLNKSHFNIKPLLQECIDKLSTIAKQKNITISLEGADIEVYADEAYLFRVIYNFLDNAIKFSPNNGSVTLCISPADKSTKISIIDHGIGIESDKLNTIWTRYYKHDNRGGMGLGLAICAEILKLHDFDYGAESTPNKITEFYFIIPKTDK